MKSLICTLISDTAQVYMEKELQFQELLSRVTADYALFMLIYAIYI